jgi:hypothetical protein
VRDCVCFKYYVGLCHRGTPRQTVVNVPPWDTWTACRHCSRIAYCLINAKHGVYPLGCNFLRGIYRLHMLKVVARMTIFTFTDLKKIVSLHFVYNLFIYVMSSFFTSDPARVTPGSCGAHVP